MGQIVPINSNTAVQKNSTTRKRQADTDFLTFEANFIKIRSVPVAFPNFARKLINSQCQESHSRA